MCSLSRSPGCVAMRALIYFALMGKLVMTVSVLMFAVLVLVHSPPRFWMFKTEMDTTRMKNVAIVDCELVDVSTVAPRAFMMGADALLNRAVCLSSVSNLSCLFFPLALQRTSADGSNVFRLSRVERAPPAYPGQTRPDVSEVRDS